jgi:hypothetical protein
VLVNPRDVLLTLSGGGNTVTVISTGYTDDTGLLQAIEVQPTGLTCTPVSPDAAPTQVKIGDFGVRSTLTCSDSTTQAITWVVEDAGNGNIFLVTTGTVKNINGTTTITAEIVYTINGSGEVIAFDTDSRSIQENFSLNYSST